MNKKRFHFIIKNSFFYLFSLIHSYVYFVHSFKTLIIHHSIRMKRKKNEIHLRSSSTVYSDISNKLALSVRPELKTEWKAYTLDSDLKRRKELRKWLMQSVSNPTRDEIPEYEPLMTSFKIWLHSRRSNSGFQGVLMLSEFYDLIIVAYIPQMSQIISYFKLN